MIRALSIFYYCHLTPSTLLAAASMPLTAVTTQLAFNGRQRQVALQCVKRASKVTYCQPTLALTCQATLSYDMLDKLTYPLGAKIRQKCQH